MKKVTRTLSSRIFIYMVILLGVSLSSLAYYLEATNRRQMMQYVYLCADRFSDIVKRTTHQSMLLNRRNEVQRIIESIGAQPGVEEIQVVNKRGEITFTTNPSALGKVIDDSSAFCSVCHSQNGLKLNLPPQKRARIFSLPNGERVLGFANPIANNPSCYEAQCHVHTPQDSILGVLEVQMSLAALDETLAANNRSLVNRSIFIIVGIAVLSGLFVYVTVRRRVKKLIAGANAFAEGQLDYRIDQKGKDELDSLASAFNSMASKLQDALQQLQETSSGLEETVKKKQFELEQAYQKLVRMEKLASLGELSATVAHEINNPLAGVLNYTSLILRVLEHDEISQKKKDSIVLYLDVIRSEVERCGKIVKNMLIFSKQSGGKFSKESFHRLLESAIMLVRHHLELKEIKLTKKLVCEDDTILCDAEQIRQLVLALCVNAIEAMQKGGVLTIRAHCLKEKNMVRLTVSDTGCGIPEEALSHVFEPFFSTKKDGKGVGLGLAVVYGIVRRHNGDINIETQLGKGTTFYVDLPRDPKVDDLAPKPVLESNVVKNQ